MNSTVIPQYSVSLRIIGKRVNICNFCAVYSGKLHYSTTNSRYLTSQACLMRSAGNTDRTYHTFPPGRLFSYSDTHRHRLGPNYLQIPVNCPYSSRISNYQRDGPMTVNANHSGAPNYYPNSFSGPEATPKGTLSSLKVSRTQWIIYLGV